LGWWSARAQPATFQNKGNQGEQNEKTRQPKKPVVMQRLPARARWITSVVSFVGMMMMLAHGGSCGRPVFRSKFAIFSITRNHADGWRRVDVLLIYHEFWIQTGPTFAKM
jgi:hypothetical protein